MAESTVCHVNKQIVNIEQYSELDTTSATMILLNNGYVVMMDTSSMINNITVTSDPLLR